MLFRSPPDIATLSPDTPVLYVLRGHTFPHGRQLNSLGYRFDKTQHGYTRTGTAGDLAAVRDLAASLKLTVHPNTAPVSTADASRHSSATGGATAETPKETA